MCATDYPQNSDSPYSVILKKNISQISGLKLIKKVHPFHVAWSKLALFFHEDCSGLLTLPRGGSSGGKTLNKHRISFKKPRHIVTLSCWWPRGPGIKSHWGGGPESKLSPSTALNGNGSFTSGWVWERWGGEGDKRGGGRWRWRF